MEEVGSWSEMLYEFQKKKEKKKGGFALKLRQLYHVGARLHHLINLE